MWRVSQEHATFKPEHLLLSVAATFLLPENYHKHERLSLSVAAENLQKVGESYSCVGAANVRTL